MPIPLSKRICLLIFPLYCCVGFPAYAAIEEQASPFELSTSIVGVGQQVTSGGSPVGISDTRFNLRADFGLGYALSSNNRLFTQVRAGQGQGVRPLASTFSGGVNSTAFSSTHIGREGDFTARVAQAWYQFDASRFQLTIGKIDPFVFFDTNELADNEAEGFLNNVFVHNPLLDSGGDVGADLYGFSPGAVVSYSLGGESKAWSASIGVFGAGNGLSFDGGLSHPFTITQLQYKGDALFGTAGSYQVYLWRNPKSSNALTGSNEIHEGVGISFSQNLSDSIGMFGRVGYSSKGIVSFDKAITLGAQIKGAKWGRDADRLGFAVGNLKTSEAYRDSGSGSGSEKQFELFYVYQINDHLHFSPSLQRIVNPLGVQTEKGFTVVGLRSNLAF